MATDRTEPSAPIWVCVDCYLTSQGYGSELDYPDSGNREPVALIPDTVDVTSGMLSQYHYCETDPTTGELTDECECETQSFSWSACEGCGSHLGGTRHALTLWYSA